MFWLLAAALGVAGCTTAPRPAPLPSPIGVEIASGAYPAAFAAAVDTLRGAGFAVDRADYRFGVVTTRPEGSPTVFEPWKTGNTTHHARVLSTLNDVRRRITVTFAGADDAGAALRAGAQPGEPVASRQMRVLVQLEARDTPGRRLNGSADRRVFSDRAPRRLDGSDAELAVFWHSLGRDLGLEAELQSRILARLDGGASAQTARDPAAR